MTLVYLTCWTLAGPIHIRQLLENPVCSVVQYTSLINLRIMLNNFLLNVKFQFHLLLSMTQLLLSLTYMFMLSIFYFFLFTCPFFCGSFKRCLNVGSMCWSEWGIMSQWNLRTKYFGYYGLLQYM